MPLIIVLFTIGLQGIATLISTLAKNEAQAMQFVLFLLISPLMVSGVFWPLEAMPATIRPLSYISPLTYANAGLRKVMLAGGGFGEIRFELAVLGVFAVVMLLLSVLSMRRQAHTAWRGPPLDRLLTPAGRRIDISVGMTYGTTGDVP